MSRSSSTQVSSTSAEQPVGTSSVAQSDIAVLNITYDRGDDGWVEKPREAEDMHSGDRCDGCGMDIGNGRRSAICGGFRSGVPLQVRRDGMFVFVRGKPAFVVADMAHGHRCVVHRGMSFEAQAARLENAIGVQRRSGRDASSGLNGRG